MEEPYDGINVALVKALDELAERKGTAFADSIRPILEESNEACRLTRVLRNGDPDTVAEYVKRVAFFYEREHERLWKLLVEKEAQAWAELQEKVLRIAYSCLRKRLPGRPTYTLQEDAQRVAAEAMISLLEGNYHYDTGFDSWLTVVITYQALKEIDRRIIPRNGEIEVDAYENWLENLEELRNEANPEVTARRHDLREAVRCLTSELLRQVIILRYFEGLTPAEIAHRLGRSKNSIYKAHHVAVKQLRELLIDGEGDEHESE